MKALILAGGKGTRLGGLTADLPKPLLPIAGKPVLEYQIELLRDAGLSDITILINHLGGRIREYCGDGSRWGVSLEYFEETEPLGTAGGIRIMADGLTDDFLVLYGDLLLNMDVQRIIRKHRENTVKDTSCVGTLMVHPNNHPYDSDLVEIDDDSGRIIRFLSKPHPDGLVYRNLVNAAVYVLTPDIFRHIPYGKSSDFGKDIFPSLLSSGDGTLYAYCTPEYLKDMGTPDRLSEAENDVAGGVFERGSFRIPKPAVFLDRDGVLNEEVDQLSSPDGFRLLPGAAEAVRKINSEGYYAVVVTNQPMIAKGLCDYGTVLEIHKKMETELGRSGAKLDAILFCPHHPEKGFPGENPEFKVQCGCRKPAAGMIARAAEELNIDLSGSYLIGDSTVDALTARNAGLRFIGVRTGYGCSDGRFADRIDWENTPMCDNVLDGVDSIFERAKIAA